MFDAPFYKIELCDGRGDIIEFYPTCSTKWIKQFLTVPIQTTLIRHMNGKILTIL